jgi:hypothetical protein
MQGGGFHQVQLESVLEELARLAIALEARVALAGDFGSLFIGATGSILIAATVGSETPVYPLARLAVRKHGALTSARGGLLADFAGARETTITRA